MGNITKTISGLIYNTEFNETHLDNVWITSPSSSYISLSDEVGFATIKDTSGCVRLLIDPVYDSYVVYTTINYTPIVNSGNNFINLPSGKKVYNEQPSGLYNGINRTFTLSEFPVLGSETIMVDGFAFTRGSSADYTIAGDVITFNYYAPTSQYDVAVTYEIANNIPFNDSSAGITLYKDIFNHLEVQNFNDPNNNAIYSHMKVLNDGNTIYVYASTDGLSWTYIGKESVEAGILVGLYVRGTETLKVDSFTLIKSDKILINKLPVGYTLKTYKQNGTLYNTTIIDDPYTTTLLVETGFQGYFEIYDNLNTLIDTTTDVLIQGGDEFEFNTSFEISMYDEDNAVYNVIDFSSENNLGFFTDSNKEIKFKIKILSLITLNTEISIMKYALVKKGLEFAELAIVTDNGLTVYNKSIRLTNIGTNQELEFQLRINRDLNPNMSFQFQDSYGFNLVIRTW